MWRELILALASDAEFRAPASEAQLQQAEVTLGHRLPPTLEALLRESDGVNVSYGVSLVWSADMIVGNNARLRESWRPGGEMGACMPIDHLVFFGELSNGDMIAFPVTAEGVRNQVFIWDHEDDSRRCEANSLREWLTGSAE